MKDLRSRLKKCPTSPSIPEMSDTKQPGDGFYMFVNEKWLEKTHIQGWNASFDVSEEITDKTNKELLDILHSIETPKVNLNPKTSKEHLQTLQYIWKKRNLESEEIYLKTCLQSLIESKSEKDISSFLGWMVRSGIPTCINLDINQEIKPPYFVRLSLISGLTILPRKYYTSDTLKSSDTWKAYESFVNTCSIELGLPFLHKAIEGELSLARIIYNQSEPLIKSGSQLLRWMPDFEWQGFMDGLDLDSNWKHRIFIVNHFNILKWICSVDIEYVVSVLALHLIAFSAQNLRPAIKNAYDNLILKSLRGVDSSPPNGETMLLEIKDILPDALCHIYSEHHSNKSTLNNINEFILDLKESALETMDHTTIFSKKIKSRAKEKIHRMTFEIGTGQPPSLPDVTYNLESFLHTNLLINSSRSRQMLSKTGKPASKYTYDYPCFITNATYFEEANHIMIPWGIIDWPFFCKDAPLGWNHGALGATICHEMVHGFDKEGSLYSPRGVYKEWWTRKTRMEFKKKTRKVTRFFSKFKHFRKNLNGPQTFSEDWADLGGMNIALRNLRNKLEGFSEEDKKEGYRNFFISYAVSWRTLIRKEALVLSLLTSVHSPGEDRVDRIVPHFQEWVDAFDIKETDKLYLEPSKRLDFF